MSSKIIFILALALLIVCVLFWRSCQSNPSSSTKRDKAVDSLVQKAIADSIVKNKVLDSANKKIAVLSHVKDSLENILALTKGSLKGKDKDIQALVDEINKAEANNDQSAALAACDSLKAQYPIAKGLVTQYISTNDSLRKSTGAIIAQKDTIIGSLNRLFTEANNQVFQFSRLYNLQSGDLKKAQKSANKRFSIGPVFGGGIADNKIVPFVGIGLTYSLIKF
jgi:hypothetical protein